MCGARITRESEARHPVLLHGFSGSAGSWKGIAQGLTEAGHEPVLVDLPGHGAHVGESDPTDFTLPATLRRIGRSARWPADLVGYSMGGRLALHFALAHPERVRRLVLESGSPGLARPDERDARRRDDEALADRLVRGGIESFVEEWESLPVFASQERLDPAVTSQQRARRLANDPQSLAASLRGVGTGALPGLWERLGEVSAPTMLIVGEFDEKFVDMARRMSADLPNASMVVVPDCGHAVHLERPHAWLRAVVGFLAADV